MKLILRQYLSDLRERDELDAILPDLLSELGFNVLSTPSRGTRQSGVDVTAVGPDEDDGGRQKLFLFTIKSGDLKRQNWDDGTPQAVRQSLNEILDSYIKNRILRDHQDLEVVICLCIGGEIKEEVRDQWTGFVERNTTDKITFREWNGDKLAGLLLSGVLREELLESNLQSRFRKSIAMVEEPEISYRFFTDMIQELLEAEESERNQLARLRQVYICLWVLFVWAREAGNLESPFRASEYAIFQIWSNSRSVSGKNKVEENKIVVLHQVVMLHLLIAEELVSKLKPYTEKPFALSRGVASQSSVDVNLALFEQFGRICLFGIWQHWRACLETEEDTIKAYADERNRVFLTAFAMINANPTLKSPIRDDFAIEISLFLILAQTCGAKSTVAGILEETAIRIVSSIECRGAYPIVTTNYHDLVRHPKNRSHEDFKENTSGSVLYPLLVAWLDKLGLRESRNRLASCIERDLQHTTQQIWVPDSDTDEKLWSGSTNHGVVITGLPLFGSPAQYTKFLGQIAVDHAAFNDLSTTRTGFSPILLMACRHFRLPVPPQLWFLEIDSQDSEDEPLNNGWSLKTN